VKAEAVVAEKVAAALVVDVEEVVVVDAAAVVAVVVAVVIAKVVVHRGGVAAEIAKKMFGCQWYVCDVCVCDCVRLCACQEKFYEVDTRS
jgi:hypothetical protein